MPSHGAASFSKPNLTSGLQDPNLIAKIQESWSTHPESINSWFASRPYGFKTRDIKLKVAFLGPLLLKDVVTRGDLDAVRNLIKRQRSMLADLSPAEVDLLLDAATKLLEPNDMVHLLLEAGLRIVPSPNASDEVHVAEDTNTKREVVELGEAIFEASGNGGANEVKALLRRGGGSVNYRDQYGLMALHAAAFKGHKDVMTVFIELAGLDLECEDEEGYMPLHMAVQSDDVGTVQVLVEKGVNLNVVNKRGANPLYMARIWGHHYICELLVNKGALYTLTPT